MKTSTKKKSDMIIEKAKSVKVSTIEKVKEPSYEDISEKATELYYQRVDRGEDGSAFDDWLLAEAILSEE